MRILLIWISLAIIFPARGQRMCGTKENVYSNLTNQPQGNGRDTLPGEYITIPVVIHILYNDVSQNLSDAAVKSQLAVLNNDFKQSNPDITSIPLPFAALAGNTRINFCIARVDPVGRPTTGIIHKHTSTNVWTADDQMKFSATGGDDAWDSKRYLNIWVCNLFGRNLGYASLPGGDGNKDGVVIQFDVFGTLGSRAPFNLGRTATHELGHWLGLRHIWGDALCGDDGIADTPPQQTYNNGCPPFPHTSSCSVNSNGDMFMNFMDFTDDACMHLFTRGQVSKMRSLFAAGGFRNSFLDSKVCDSIQAQGSLPADSTPVVSNITLYPNPAVSQLTISSNTKDIIGKVFTIYDVLGKRYFSGVITAEKNTVSISGLPGGMYIIKMGVNALLFMKQ